jgi:hypothetical protein
MSLAEVEAELDQAAVQGADEAGEGGEEGYAGIHTSGGMQTLDVSDELESAPTSPAMSPTSAAVSPTSTTSSPPEIQPSGPASPLKLQIEKLRQHTEMMRRQAEEIREKTASPRSAATVPAVPIEVYSMPQRWTQEEHSKFLLRVSPRAQKMQAHPLMSPLPSTTLDVMHPDEAGCAAGCTVS